MIEDFFRILDSGIVLVILVLLVGKTVIILFAVRSLAVAHIG
jgi:hypothetical protein